MVTVLALGLIGALAPMPSLASTRSELDDALAHQRSLAAQLSAARRDQEAVQTEVDLLMARIHLRRLPVAVADERLLRMLMRQDPEMVDRLAAAKRAVRDLVRRRRAVDRRVATLKERRAEELSRLFQVCPVDQPRSYRDDFGMISIRGGVHVHQGIDIHAPYGTPIRAPFSGLAEVATNAVGGLAVKVFGPNGFVYNAHLSRLGTLGQVQDGDVIGYVGSSGNAVAAAPHDHFEWHPGNGRAANPFSDLNAAC